MGRPDPVPGYAEDLNKRIYVWFDAVIGYLSASSSGRRCAASRMPGGIGGRPGRVHALLPGQGQHRLPHGHLAGDPDRLRRGWRGAARPPSPALRRVATEYLTMEGKQFSSSRAHVILLPDFLTATTRIHCATTSIAASPETHDTDFTWADFVRRNNDELVATWGNLVNRTLTNAHRTFGAVPEPGALDRGGHRRCSTAIDGGLRHGRPASRGRPVPRRARRGDAARFTVNQYISRPGALGAHQDRPGAAPRTVLDVVAPRRRQPEDDLHAVPAVHLAAPSTSCSGTTGCIAGPLEFREVDEHPGDTHEILTGDYSTWVGGWEPSDLQPGPAVARAAAALQPSSTSRSSPRSSANARRRRRVIDTHAHLERRRVRGARPRPRGGRPRAWSRSRRRSGPRAALARRRA